MNESIQTIVLVLGFVLLGIGNLWFIVEGFKTGILWGLGILFLPFVAFFFLLTHWSEAKRPFFLELSGGGMIILAVLLSHGHHLPT